MTAGTTARPTGDGVEVTPRPRTRTPATDSRSERITSICALGDPLADTVATELHHRGHAARRSLANLLAGTPGIGGETLTPAQSDLRFEVHDQACELDELLTGGALVHHRAEPALVRVAHGVGAVAHVGTTSSTVWPTLRLVDGGRLGSVAHRRVVDAVRWAVAALEPGGLCIDAPGHRATLRLRLRAAMQRHAQRNGLKSHFDPVLPGAPTTQLDLVHCWLGATSRARRLTLSATGGDPAGPEPAELHLLRQHLGRLLGVHTVLLHATDDQLAFTEPATVEVRPVRTELATAVRVAVADGLGTGPHRGGRSREQLLAAVRALHERVLVQVGTSLA